MVKVVFDTYAWIEYFEGSKKGEIVKGYLEDSEVLTPVAVLLELSYKADRDGWDFKKHLNFIKLNSKIIGFNEEFILSFGNVYNRMKKRIKDFGLADAIVLNTANLHDAKILTGDKHFSGINEAIII